MPPVTWLSQSDKNRLKQYQENSLLYKGEYVKVWKDLRPLDTSFQPIIFNYSKLLTAAIANLLFREPPVYLAENEDPKAQAALDRIIKQTRFNTLNKKQSTWGSVLGDMVYLVRWEESRGLCIEYVHPKNFFGVFNPLDTSELDAAILAYAIYSADSVSGDQVSYVYRQVHLPDGEFRNELWEANDEQLLKQVPLGTLPQFAEFPETASTGIDELSVVHARNLECPGEPYGLSDYSTAQKTKFHAVCERMTQMNMVLAKHADPKLMLPQQLLDSFRDENSGQVVVRKEDLDMLGLQPNQAPAEYLTWDGQLEASFKAVEKLGDAILEEGQISPALLGRTGNGIEGGETGRASVMKLLASLGFANSKQQLLEPALQRVLRVAQKLENARLPKAERYEVSEVQVRWSDGLPADTREMVEIEATKVREHLSSRFSAIKRITGATDVQVREELTRIEEEAEADNPIPALLPQGASDADL